jgi:hypothetical protein
MKVLERMNVREEKKCEGKALRIQTRRYDFERKAAFARTLHVCAWNSFHTCFAPIG